MLTGKADSAKLTPLKCFSLETLGGEGFQAVEMQRGWHEAKKTPLTDLSFHLCQLL